MKSSILLSNFYIYVIAAEYKSGLDILFCQLFTTLKRVRENANNAG